MPKTPSLTTAQLHCILQLMQTAQQSTINPAFALRHSDKLREVTGELHRVFDNLLEIARGDTPDSTGYDRLRATRVLYDRGFGKVARNQARIFADTRHFSEPDPEPAEDEAPRAAAERHVVRLEQEIDDTLGPPQAPAEPEREETMPGEGERETRREGLPAPSPDTPGYLPDLVRESQYYIMEITNYGDDLASILMNIHEPDPEDDSIRDCHRITAGMMILDRVLGPTAEIGQFLQDYREATEDSNWMIRHPAEIDSAVTPEELNEANRATRELLDEYRKQREDCEDCTDEDACDEHYMDKDDMLLSARVFRNMRIYGSRIYFDLERGGVKLHPRNYIDDS